MPDNIIRVKADSWIEEIEAARPTPGSREYTFTKEMDRDLLLMRNPQDGQLPLYWKDVLRLWRKRYGKASGDVLRSRLRHLMGENNE